MLLTDEEMKALRPDVAQCTQDLFDCSGCSADCGLTAKAQLKKVVEKLLPCQGLKRDDFDDKKYMFLTIAVDDFQSLLDEVK